MALMAWPFATSFIQIKNFNTILAFQAHGDSS